MGEQGRAKGYLGFVVGHRGGRLVVVGTNEGSPAHRAGIARGDFLVRIDDESTEGLSRKAAAERLRGFAGEPVTLWLERPGVSELLRFDLVREERPTTKGLAKPLLQGLTFSLFIASLVFFARAATAPHRDAVERYASLLREQRFEEAHALLSEENHANRSFEAWRRTLEENGLARVDALTITNTQGRGSGRGCVSAVLTTEGKRVGLTFFTQTTSSGTRIREVLTNAQISGVFQKGPWQCD